MTGRTFVPTRVQLRVLEDISRGDEYAGNDGAVLLVALQLERKGLLLRQAVATLPLWRWRLTLVGKRVLRESVERAED